MRAWVRILLVCGLLGVASAQEPASLVFAGKAGWVPPRKARELGFFEYEGRWLPKKLRRKIERWEKQDRRVQGWSDAYGARTRHYRVTTSLPRFVVELEVKPFLDELYRTYAGVFRRDFGLSGKGADKKSIRIYDGYRDYAMLAKGGNPPVPRENPGFILGGKELVVYYDETDPALFFGTVFHEGAHQFVKNLLPAADLPIWLDEALACYFEGCTYSRTTGKITVGHLPPARLRVAQQVLAETRPDPVRLFMGVPESEFRAREYALAWSFVYYLTHCENGKYKRKFARFLRAANGSGKRSITEQFRRAGIPLDELQDGWREFVLGLEAEPEPVWILLELEEPYEGLRTGDKVWSIGGRRFDAQPDFEAFWQAYSAGETVEWVVVRRRGEDDVFVRRTVTGKPRLTAMRTLTRSHALAD